MINYKIYENFDRKLFDEIKSNHNDFIFNLFQLLNWIEVVTETTNKLYKLKIIVIYNNQKIICIVPLCIKIFGSCKQLSWLSSEIIDYNNCIFSKNYLTYKKELDETWRKIINEISPQCDLIYFDKVPEYVNEKKNPLLNSYYKFNQFTYQLNLENYNFEEFYKSKNNNKTIQTDRRKEKKLNEGNDLFFAYEDCTAENFLEVKKLILEKIEYYKNQKIKTFETDIINKYKKLIFNNNEDYKFKISHCFKGDQKISSIFGVIHQNIFYYLVPVVYKSEFTKYSPGKFHIINLIKWSLENNLKLIDFSPGDENYKLIWSNEKFKIFYYIKLITLNGFFRFIKLKLYHHLRKNSFIKKIYNLIGAILN